VLGSGNYIINAISSTTSKLNLFANPVIDVSNGLSGAINVILTGTGFTKAGGGSLLLNPGGFNVVNGTTYVVEGMLTIGSSSPNRRVIAGDLVVTNGGVARLGNSQNITNNAVVSLYAGSTLDMNGRNQTLGGLLLENATILQSATETLTVT